VLTRPDPGRWSGRSARRERAGLMAQHASDGSLTGSTNPFVDEHVMDALALIAVAAFGTGSRLGLGTLWAKLSFVKRHRVLL